MRLEHGFTVPVPVDAAWEVLLDLPRIAPCLPGATLTAVDGDTFAGTVKVKLGPVVLTYTGKGRFVERDEAAHRVVIEASGRDIRSAGTATASVTAALTPAGEDSTKVEVTTDLTITGRPAQFGRGMIADVATKLIGQFADCLAGKLGAVPAPSSVAAAAPVAGAEPAPEPTQLPAPEPTQRPASPPAAVVTPAPTVVTPAAAVVTRPVSAPVDPEPIDVLRLTGGTDAARRLAVVGIATLAGLALAALTWRAIRRLRR